MTDPIEQKFLLNLKNILDKIIKETYLVASGGGRVYSCEVPNFIICSKNNLSTLLINFSSHTHTHTMHTKQLLRKYEAV